MNLLYFESEKYYRIANDYLLYDGNLRQAKRYVNKSLKVNSKHIKSLVLKGRILLCENRIKQAKDLFNEALKLDSNNIHAHSLIASCYNTEKKYCAALEHINKAISLENTDKELLFDFLRLKVELLINMKLFNKAKQLLKKLNYYLYTDAIDRLKQEYSSILGTGHFCFQKEDKRVFYIF